MSKSKIKRVDKESPDLLKENVERLKELFPGIVSEGKIDLSRLRDILGDEVDERPERYSFTWAGKRDAIRMLQAPSRATLVPAPEESVNFGDTNNVFIEGENLEVLKLLYKSYAGRVKMIYIDPPYNTGKDFIYPDNFADPLDTYLKLTGQKDSEGNLLTSNPETSGRFHSAWLSMMYPRLFVARQLLRKDGVIFISIGDNEVVNLRKICDEIFGEENCVGLITWKARVKPVNIGEAKYRPQKEVEYVLVYQREYIENTFQPLHTGGQRTYPHELDGRKYRLATILKSNRGSNQRSTMIFELEGYTPPEGQRWQAGEDVIHQLYVDGYIEFCDGTPFRRYFEDEEGAEHDPFYCFMEVDWASTSEVGKNQLNELLGNNHGFDTVKPTRLIQTLIQSCTHPEREDIVLDFFAGSCTLAHALYDQNRQDNGNRRYILVQLPEPCDESLEVFKADYKTITDIGKERIRRVIKKLKKEKQPKFDFKKNPAAEDLGFKVFKLAESNYKPWKGVEKRSGKDYSETMEMFTDSLAKGWNPTNVIYEVALKEGYSLNIKIDELKEGKANRVYKVTDPGKGQSFMICLDNDLKQASVKALNLKKEDLFICRDAALTDELAANLALQCKLKTI